MGKLRVSASIIAVAVLGFLNPIGLARASDDWMAPVANVIDGKEVPATYKPIPVGEVTKHWKICVLFPHMKDSYWLAADYGVVVEAKRDHLDLQLYQAGGYTNLSTQLNQMDNCIAQAFDAIVLGAISADGVASAVDKAIAKGIPVIDFVNGVNDPKVSAHALVSFHDLAVTTAKFIIESSGGKPVNVGYFPGPQGAGWSDDAVRGFEETIKGTNVKIAVTRRGDTGENIQLALIQNALQAYPDINYLVGVDIAAQAAAVAVRNLHLEGKVKIMAFDIIPPVYQDIEDGATVGSPTDFTVIQGRMAVDMAVRLLEKQKLEATRSGPTPKMVTKDNIKSIPWTDMFAPKDFPATYTLNAQ
ncbi:MAG: TMAO reductase system periplasmic protein TorT [Steroidobacteraceae bacterium]|jgi:protein TorT